MTYQGENDIPTPRQAMAEAVKAANANDPALGRLWLDIATELRVGTPAVEVSAAAHEPPAAHPRTLEERTQVFAKVVEAMVGTCRHCHTPIYRDASANEPFWLHRYTQQAACLRPQLAQGDDQVPGAHTWAEPLPAEG